MRASGELLIKQFESTASMFVLNPDREHTT
jgi:hypothetical protein